MNISKLEKKIKSSRHKALSWDGESETIFQVDKNEQRNGVQLVKVGEKAKSFSVFKNGMMTFNVEYFDDGTVREIFKSESGMMRFESYDLQNRTALKIVRSVANLFYRAR